MMLLMCKLYSILFYIYRIFHLNLKSLKYHLNLMNLKNLMNLMNLGFLYHLKYHLSLMILMNLKSLMYLKSLLRFLKGLLANYNNFQFQLGV
tara:strand:+ start:1625 stop:1900 length:276 start_codon:yes stop_codon:yes gene_type:complete